MRAGKIINTILAASMLFLLSGCIKPFLAPPSTNNLNFLVVDGTITVGAPIKIKLSRTKNLIDTVETVPESGAQMQLESASGLVFPFVSTAQGVYAAEGATALEQYRLRIRTNDGKEYLSDFVETKISPAIDSLEWQENDDIFIYVNTHDPEAKARYYRWEFEETEEYHAVYDSNIEYRDSQLLFLRPDEMRYVCYRYYPSNGILVSSSDALGADVISHFQVTRIPNDNSKISFRYSILVKQYALTAEAYQYWQIIKQNSEQTGNIFDPQPSQLYGNIKCVDNPSEPVIGFISASTLSEKRIFIRQSQLRVIKHPNNESCREFFIAPSDAPLYLESGRFLPAYFQQGALAIAPRDCVDCRLRGGSTTKPSYW